MNINKIANMADMLKPRATKSECMTIVQGMCNGEEVNDVNLTILYQYFTPTLPKQPKTPEQWVWLAVAKKDIRNYLNYIYSDGKRIIATNGNRLHAYKTDQYEPGYYDKNMVKLEDKGNYPDIDRVIPKLEKIPLTLNPTNLPKPDVLKDGDIDSIHSRFYKLVPGDFGFNKTYIDQAVSSIPNFDTINYADDSACALMQNDKFTAVIMPTRI